MGLLPLPTMKRGTKDKVEGKLHEVKGTLVEHVGKLTGDGDLEAEGEGEKIGGKVQHVIGKVEKALGE